MKIHVTYSNEIVLFFIQKDLTAYGRYPKRRKFLYKLVITWNPIKHWKKFDVFEENKLFTVHNSTPPIVGWPDRYVKQKTCIVGIKPIKVSMFGFELLSTYSLLTFIFSFLEFFSNTMEHILSLS